jgi:uncharacterized protein
MNLDNPYREFQVFVKPVGPSCNLDCSYCYYLQKEQLYPAARSFRMSNDLLEAYIKQHIQASTEPIIFFSWHGGEPTLAGLDFFREVVRLQKALKPAGCKIMNGLQTNGTLLDDRWCSFFAEEGFIIGISLDGPREFHDHYRVTKDHKPTFERVINGYKLLRKHCILTEILCVVNAANVQHPLQVYRFFKDIKAEFITFLPLVEYRKDEMNSVSQQSVPAKAFGIFLSSVFDEWMEQDIGHIKIQIFEESVRTAFHQDHTLCIFKKTCGGVPVVEHNGDFFSCDHFVDDAHCLGNIKEKPLTELLDSPVQKAFGQKKLDRLPRYCLSCEVRDMCNGECPRNRFIKTPDGEDGLNYLCEGYRYFFNHCLPFVQAVADQWKGK